MIESSKLFEKLTARLGSNLLATTVEFGEPVVTVEKSAMHDTLSFLKEDGQLSYTMLVELFGVDYQGQEPRFEIVCILRSMEHNGRVTIKTRTSEEGTETISDLWLAANWLEREMYDMFGINFRNHPNLTRIYTDEDFEGFPLRKDFPLEGADFDKPFVVNLEDKKA